ncbi:unnamed protein product [Ectocarpus sp. 12 AP-2014]
MSFFTSGFATMVNNRRLKAAKKAGTTNADKSVKSSDKEEKNDCGKEEEKDEGKWDMLTDVYGRAYWQHSVTDEWAYVYGGGLSVPPVVAVSPTPMVYPHGVVFTPPPVYAAAPNPLLPAKKKDTAGGQKDGDEKDEKKEKGKGWWEVTYDEDGDRYWEHTVTKKTTYKDPYY